MAIIGYISTWTELITHCINPKKRFQYRFCEINSVLLLTYLQPGENGYVGEEGVSRIYLNPLTGQVIVTSTETGEEFYNYYIHPINTHPNVSGYGHVGTPVTSITQQNPNQLYAEITEGDFRFSGVLSRTSPSANYFIGSDNQVRVMYDRDAGRIVIINVVTGDEFYNYPYSPGSGFAD